MCGIFGVYNNPRAVELTKLGLYALQHRGQESVGIAYRSGDRVKRVLKQGLVQDAAQDPQFAVQSDLCLGHVRYSTTGSSDITNAQPILADTPYGQIAIAHNGNLTNSLLLRRQFFDQKGYIAPVIFHSTSDTELILWLVASIRKDSFLSALKGVLEVIKGAYSLLIMTSESLIAVRDPNGFRPLCLGKSGDSYAVASETCALELTSYEVIREIGPGEIVVIDRKGIRTHRYARPKESFCAFEYIYFARPDSILGKGAVYEMRKQLGRELAKLAPVKADVVTGIPDSGNPCALGFAEESRIPYDYCFMRNHYVGRTFIEPSMDKRAASVRVKLSAIKSSVEGRRIVVADDSIVRGTTVKNRIKLLRDAGAKEVHLRISCPPIKNPCVYGIDFPDPAELIANSKSIDEIAKHIGADSLVYMPMDSMKKIINGRSCFACWNGEYPVPPDDKPEKLKFQTSQGKC